MWLASATSGRSSTARVSVSVRDQGNKVHAVRLPKRNPHGILVSLIGGWKLLVKPEGRRERVLPVADGEAVGFHGVSFLPAYDAHGRAVGQ